MVCFEIPKEELKHVNNLNKSRTHSGLPKIFCHFLPLSSGYSFITCDCSDAARFMSFSYGNDLTFKEAKRTYNDAMEHGRKIACLIHIQAKPDSLGMVVFYFYKHL